MLQSPFLFESELSAEDYQTLGRLSLKWSHFEHVIGNCLRVMMRLNEDEAIVVVFPMSLDQRFRHLKELAKLNTLNAEATAALNALTGIIKGIQYVRNGVVHAIAIPDPREGHVFHLRSKQRTLTKAQIFSTEELTNYAAHAAYALRCALGVKDTPDARHTLPERPAIPEFIPRDLISR
jgi:hypothetical protein